ncbi:MAG: T9SS type A sorting domain-containing protein [Bacteroidetes bacterium]|nr:T9SS type A sorting domain-containing protein [Bacteroidota bacterium]
MTSLKRSSLLLAIIVAFICIHNSNVYAQYYDLSVGTERFFDEDSFSDARIRIDIGENNTRAIERVIDEVVVDGVTWAIVEWTKWTQIVQPSGTHLIISSDTLYYRMDGSILYEYSNGAEIPVFDFHIELGDSLFTRFQPFMSDNLLQQFQELGDRGGVLLADTTITFPGGSQLRMLWGDGTAIDWYQIPSAKVFVEEILIEREGWLYPYNSDKSDVYNPFMAFFHVEDFGSLYSVFNHREMFMSGFKSLDGRAFGRSYEVPTSLNEVNQIPVAHILHQNYPNPFNPTTQIRFSLPMESAVELDVYTITGQHVANLVSEVRPAGTHQVTFDASDLASGVYMYRIRAGNYIETRKLTLIR